MAAGKYNIQAERNEALLITMTYQDDANAGIDLTGVTVSFTLKDNGSDLLGVSPFNPMTLTVTNAATGEFTIDIAKEQINAIPFKQGIYYIDLSGAISTRLVEGKFQIKSNSAY